MIYLIGGAPRCGKTTVAKRLSNKLRIPWISADTLESIVSEYIPTKEFDRVFPKSRLRRLTKQSNDQMYRRFSAKEITNAYISQAHASWNAIKMMVDVELQNGHDYIIEGHQLHPKLMHQIIRDHSQAEISAIILTKSNIDKIVSGCLKHSAKNDWFIKKTTDPDTYQLIAGMIAEYSKYFRNEARKYDLPLLETDHNYRNKIREAVRVLA